MSVGEQAQQRAVDCLVAGEDRAGPGAGREFVAAPVEIGDEAAGLADDEDAGGDVPGVEAVLPETVEAARGHPGEVERGRAAAADACCLAHDPLQLREIAFAAL